MRLYPKSREEAVRLKEDYEFLGIPAFLEGNVLVVGQVRKRKKVDKNEKNNKKRGGRERSR